LHAQYIERAAGILSAYGGDLAAVALRGRKPAGKRFIPPIVLVEESEAVEEVHGVHHVVELVRDLNYKFVSPHSVSSILAVLSLLVMNVMSMILLTISPSCLLLLV